MSWNTGPNGCASPCTASWSNYGRNNNPVSGLLLIGDEASIFVLAEDRVSAFVRGCSGEQLLFAVDQVAGVVGGQLKTVAVRNGVGGTGFHAIAAEDAAVVIDVVDLGVTLSAAYAMAFG